MADVRPTRTPNSRTTTPHQWPCSFEELWNGYERPLTWFVANTLRRSPGSPDVADAVQDIICRLYDRQDRYSSRYSLRSWVYSVGRNYCIDRIRRASGRDDNTIPDADRLRDSHSPGPLEQLVAQQELEEVDRLMSSLAPANRTILFLRYFEEMSFREIARIVGRPEGTIRYRVHEIRQKLKDNLEVSDG